MDVHVILCKRIHSQKGKWRPKSRAGTGLHSPRQASLLSFIKALNGLAAPAKVGWKVALKGESMGTELSKDFVSHSAAATPTVELWARPLISLDLGFFFPKKKSITIRATLKFIVTRK